ncbi:hypothetical protein FDV58_21890 [Bradyrhizobium elkanii]|uniref:Uncharacterized protein n=1 Tax=Bradyrhizobium elkanii TaxID=29448 RepID=A0A4U6RVV8_BRAEL|nr:hypothetical protein [Bradyrhizobium sp. BR2003]TKV79289.1 hypothetical protein FDV58_21890 [Bradyrhizobium elkanii]
MSWPGLSPAMTVFPVNKDVDARDKPGHDEWRDWRSDPERSFATPPPPNCRGIHPARGDRDGPARSGPLRHLAR